MDEKIAEAISIVELARTNDVTLRILGGIAFNILSPCVNKYQPQRIYHDIDFAGFSSQATNIISVLSVFGYVPEKRFNVLHGKERLRFVSNERNFELDVFLDCIRECHTLYFGKRLEKTTYCLTPTDLLLSKLQMTRMGSKDILDTLCLLQDCCFGTTIDAFNEELIGKILGENWGFYHTVELNIPILESHIVSNNISKQFDKAWMNLEKIKQVITNCRKTFFWKARRLLGEKIPWYTEPDEVIELI